MPKIGDISVEVPSGGTNHVDTPAEFLYENQSQITDATSLLSDGRITSIPSDVTTVLETSPGLSASAFNVGGNAPLNAVAEKFASSTSTEYELFNSLKSTIESDANRHMVEEGGQNYVVIFTKYKELIEEVTEAVNAYNADRDAGSEEVRTDDSEDTITRKKYYPECSFSCSMTSPPTISFISTATTNTSRTVSASDSPHYKALKEAYDKAKAFYDRYCEDAIAFKDATSGLMAEGESYDFEADLTKLENDWPEGVGATETPTEEEKKEDKEEEDKKEDKTDDGSRQTASTQVSQYDRVDVDPNLASSLGVDQEGHELHYYGSLKDAAGNVIPIYYDSGEHNETYIGCNMWTHDAARLFTIINGEKCYLSNNPETYSYNDTKGKGDYGAGTAFHYDVSILTNSDGSPAETYERLDGLSTVTDDAQQYIFYNQTTPLAEDGKYFYKDQEGNTITLDGNSWSHSSELQDIGNYSALGGGE